MAYNITNLHIKKNNKFAIKDADLKTSLFCFFCGWDSEEYDVNVEGNNVTFTILYNHIIKGKIKGDWVYITDLEFCGEWSGTVWCEIILPVLESKNSTRGEIEIPIIWEEGDLIHCVTIKDGKFSEEALEFY